MSKKIKNVIRNHAEFFLMVSVGVVFVLVYVIGKSIIGDYGIYSSFAQNCVMDISAVAGILVYLVLIVWELRNL